MWLSLEVHPAAMVARREGDGSLSWFPRALGFHPAVTQLAGPFELHARRVNRIGPAPLPAA